MTDIVDFIAQGDTDLRPALERAVAEIERLQAEVIEAVTVHNRTVEMLTEKANLVARADNSNQERIAELEDHHARNLGWEKRAREAEAEIKRLKATLQWYAGHLRTEDRLTDSGLRARAALEGK